METAQRPTMAALLGETLFTISGQSPSPSKDLYTMSVTHTQVIWRRWKVCLRTVFRGAAPEEFKMSHDEFLHDTRLQHQVGVVFGSKVLAYCVSLCEGHIDYLERLPDQLLLQILSFLGVQDLSHLEQTSRRFRKLCNSECIWEREVRLCSEQISEDLEKLAEELGWKTIYKALFKTHQPSSSEDQTREPEEHTGPEPEPAQTV
ncbi:F-box only protein 36a [Hoplias malabaricus]|uniref:F-box only protein 36a n=1 Tax=Hoplias malabaricus TaxID=27720 RepID=UPI003462ECFC